MKKYACLILVFIFLTACTSSKKFISIRCVYDKDAQLRPGGSVPFGVIAQHKNGQKILTKGYLKGKYKFDNYEVAVQGGWYDGGVIFIDTAQINNVNQTVKVAVKPVKKQSLVDSFELKLNYEGIVTWNFSGEPGKNGDSKSSRILPIRIAGTAIADGKAADPGDNGTDAQDVTLYVYKIHDSEFYNRTGYDVYAVKTSAQNGGNEKYTFIAEKYGKLILKANGGDGGRGGNGGRGPDGRDADAYKVAGSGSNGGAGGLGGNGGKAGHIKVIIDTDAKDFVKYLEIQNKAGRYGSGGIGGAPGKGGKNLNGTYQPDGLKGVNGQNGLDGAAAPEPEIVYDYVRF